MAAVTEFQRASGTQGSLASDLRKRLLSPNGPTTSDTFTVDVEAVWLQAFGLVDGDEIEIQMVSGPVNSRSITQWRPAGGRDLILSTRLNSMPVVYPGVYRLRRRVGATGATVFRFVATVAHDWTGFYTNIGDEAAPPYADESGYADYAGSIAFKDSGGGFVSAGNAQLDGTLQLTAQPLDDQGGSAALPADVQVAGTTTMQTLLLNRVDVVADGKYRFEFIGYFSCNSAGGLKVDILCSNASYCNYSTTIQHSAGTISDYNLASGTAVGGTGFTKALVRIVGYVFMSADGVIAPRFGQQVANVSPTTALQGCDLNVTKRSRY